jgi:hypothetical protein
MRVSFTLCSAALILVTSLVFAGTTGKIAGVVRDAQSGEPLPSVNVVIEGTMLGAATNPDGYFVILNIPPGRYKIVASLVGYKTASSVNVRVDIDQTTDLNLRLTEETIAGEEVTVVATRPVVQRDVAASRANIEIQDIEKLPVTSVTSVVTLQAGIQGGLVIRGSSSDQAAFVVDGMTMRDERTNQPFTGISISSIQDVQVQTGGFNAEYGNLRSGVVNVVTREGGTAAYSFNFIGRYSPAGPKHFGPSIYDRNSYWIRPFVDDAVCWNGTTSSLGPDGLAAWDKWTQAQYADFEGWNSISQKLLADADPNNNLTPQGAQKLWLWEHRRQAEIKDPDWDLDMGFGGPIPGISQDLGNLRFFASYRQQVTQYLIPLSRPAYREWNGQLKLTSDIGRGMKLIGTYLRAQMDGTNDNNLGNAGFFGSASSIAGSLTASNSVSGYVDARIFGTDYWAPTTSNVEMFGAKLSHAIDPTTFYEATIQRFSQSTDTNPGTLRDTTKRYEIVPGYFVSEMPFGYWPYSVGAAGITGMRMGVGMSNSRDTSQVVTYSAKFDVTSQLDKYNQVKAGLELAYTDNWVRSRNEDIALPSGRYNTAWHNYPIRGALYLQDKLEFEGMIANLGLRLEYLNPNGDWYEYANDEFNGAFSGQALLDTALKVVSAPTTLTVSPRLAVAFPISDDAKLFFNYGHFRQIPDPLNLFLIRRYTQTNQISSIADPGAPFPLTVAYELGYEHSFFDEFLLRVAAYYKDISNQAKTVNYYGRNSLVNYTQRTSNQYQDFRGFEVQLNKNRGNWVQGFINFTYDVRTTGYFGLGSYFESAVDQRAYERSNVYQEKPIPQPYARANIDFFTPSNYGPEVGGLSLLGDWRLNLIGSWSSGRYATWAGGGSIPGLEYNVQWEDYWNVDMRLSKNFRVGPANVQFFVDVSNLFNFRYFPGTYGFFGNYDYDNYMKSLHMPDFPEQFRSLISYVNVPGEDRPGAVRKEGVTYQPIVAVKLLTDLDKAENQHARPFYYVAENGQYYQFVNGQRQAVDPGKLEQVLDDKAYIDMPNQEAFTFLNPRNIFYGIRFSIEL